LKPAYWTLEIELESRLDRKVNHALRISKKVVPKKKRSLPKLTTVTGEQVTEISRLHFNFPYNFGPAPRPGTKTTLAEFVRDCESEFPYAIRDLVDKLKLETFSAESFDHHIDRELLATPGHLSAVTVAKLIHYCLLILESEAEMIASARIDQGASGTPDARDIAGAVAAKVNRYESLLEIPEYDHLAQFLSAVKHPIVGRAVSNAAVNRWGTSEQHGMVALS
jgi:hypothetical protein